MSLPGCPHKEKGFPYIQYKHLISAYTHRFSPSHHPPLYHRALMISLQVQEQAGFSFFSLYPSPAYTTAVPSSSTCRASAPASDHFDTSLLNLFQFIDTCFVLEGGKTGQSIQDAAQRALSTRAQSTSTHTTLAG